MLLTPHHYQQWDQYYEALLIQRLKLLSPFGWGVFDLDIDHDGLANGRFAMLGLRAVMPDGLIIHVPDVDVAPQVRPIGDLFPPSKDRLGVFVGVPIERQEEINCQLERGNTSRMPRYNAEYIRCIDTNTGDNPREVLVAKKNLKILFEGEESPDTVILKIAELVHMPSGAIGVCETFIPPCLCIAASPYLMRLLGALLEMLIAKTNSFVNPQRGILEMVGTDLGKFSLINSLHSHLPVLTHMHHVGQVHPEILYLTLAQLAGQLIMLAPSDIEMKVTLYDHDNLSHTFRDLDRRIRAIIEGVTPTRHISIPLETSGDNMWVGRVPESRLFGSSQFFLAVSGDLPEDQIRSLIPQYIKIGSPAKLKEIVAAAMPGVRLYHTPRPPATIPVKLGHQYFRFDDRGVFWEEIKRSQVIALHIPESLHNLAVQLLAAKE